MTSTAAPPMNRLLAVRRVLYGARAHWRLVALGMFLGLADAWWGTRLAVIQRDLIDLVNRGQVARLQSALWANLGVIVALVVVGAGGQFLKSLASNLAARDFRKGMLVHALRLPLAAADTMHTGDLVSRTTGDAAGATGAVLGSLYGMFDATATVVVAVTLLARLQPALALLTLAAGPVIFLSGRFFDRALRTRAELIQRNAANLRKMLQEDLQGMGVVRAFGLQAAMMDRFDTLRRETMRLKLAQAMTNSFMGQVAGLSTVAVMLTCALVAALAAVRGQMSPGTVVAFVYLVGRVTEPFTGLSRTWGGLQEGLGSAKRVFDILDLAPEADGWNGALFSDHGVPKAASTSGVPVEEAPALDLRHVSFAYPGREPVLHDISLKVSRGEMVGVVGPSGSGKSTLAKVCLGLYMPNSGEVAVAGHDLRTALAQGRAHTSYAPQLAHVFADTIRANVAYGCASASAEGIELAVAQAGLAPAVADLEGGLDAKVGERGVNLSGGQRQRLALARAMVREADLVVLDEATSALDNETEALVKDAVQSLTADSGVLCIAHRLTTVVAADRIVVLEAGRIAEEGTHLQLVACGGVYARLWALANQQEQD